MSRALVIACNEQFAPGAEVLLFSFLRENPWFRERILVISGDASVRARAALRALYPVDFIEPDPALLSIARQARRLLRASAAFVHRLGVLQIFALKDCRRFVFLDADLLCLGDLRALFDAEAPFVAAPDHFELRRGGRRDPADALHPYGRALSFTFNSGVLSVSGDHLQPTTYRDLLHLPGLLTLAGGAREAADQYVLNNYFAGRITPLHPRYNFLLAEHPSVHEGYDLDPSDVRLLHFAALPKPWQLSLDAARSDLPSAYYWGYERWHASSVELRK